MSVADVEIAVDDLATAHVEHGDEPDEGQHLEEGCEGGPEPSHGHALGVDTGSGATELFVLQSSAPNAFTTRMPDDALLDLV